MANEFLIKNGFISQGNSIINGGLTATTISATTYLNLPSSYSYTGLSNSNNIITLTNNTGGTLSTVFNTVTGLTASTLVSVGSLAVGTGVPTAGIPVNIQKNQNQETGVYIDNQNGSTAASTSLYVLGSGNEYGQLAHLGSGYTTNGLLTPNLSWLTGSDTILIGTRNANDLIFHTNGFAVGNERMRITSNGKVGIGTTAPAQILEVSSSTTNLGRIRLTQTSTTSGGASGLEFYGYTGSSTTFGGGIFRNQSTNAISLYTGADVVNPRLTILDAGSVGIGTDTPTEFFHVKKDQNIATAVVVENESTGTSAYASYEARNGTSVNEATRLGVLSSSYTTSGGFIADSGFITTESNISEGLSIITRHASAPIRFYTGGHTNQRMIITSGGSVGINNTSPVEKLSITDSVATNTAQISTLASGGASKSYFGNFNDQLFLTAGGKYSAGWIGDSATRTIPYLTLAALSADSYIAFATTATNNVAATERMRILASGNIGLGTSIPNQNLSINRTLTSTNWDALSINNSGSWAAAIGKHANIIFTDNVGLNHKIAAIGATYTGTYGRIDFHSLYSGGYGVDENVVMSIVGNNRVGIGTITPTNSLSVTPTQYSTGTASQTLTTVTGVGTTWTAAMVGSQFVYADGTSSGTITGFISTTSLTVTTSQTVTSQAYIIGYTGLEVTSTGNVGVGTVVPDAYSFGVGNKVLTIAGTSTANSIGVIDLVGGTTGRGVINFGTVAIRQAAITSVNTSDITFANNTANTGMTLSEKMRILANGNVGIGTTAPTEKLCIVGVDAINNAILNVLNLGHQQTGAASAAGIGTGMLFQIQSTTTSARDAAQIASIFTTATDATRTSSLTFSVVNNAAALSEKLRILGDGNVGIGTTTPATLNSRNTTLEVASTAVNTNTPSIVLRAGSSYSTNPAWEMFLNNSTGAETGFNIASGASIKMHIRDSGNVGIGTTAPLAKLHVVGDIISTAITNSNLISTGSISATTYLNLPTDVRVTGGTYNGTTGITTLTNNTGGTFTITGFLSTIADKTITGITNSNNLITLTNNTGGTLSSLFNTVSGLTSTGTIASIAFSGTSLDIKGPDVDNALLARFYSNTGTRGSFGIRNGVGALPTTFIGTLGASENLAIGANNGIEVMRVNATGKVIIGTGTTAATKLHVVDLTEQLRVGYDASNYLSTTVGSTGGVTFNAVGAGGTFSFSGAVTINNAADVKLVFAKPTANIFSIQQDVSRLYFYNNTTSNPLFTMLNGGNVGVGTVSPSAKIHSLANSEQLRLGYDTSNYFSTTVGIGGDVTFNSVGTGSTMFIYNNNVDINGGLTANTISATTYLNLPIDIRITGGTYSNGTTTLTNNTGGTFNISGFITGDTYWISGSSGTNSIRANNGTTVSTGNYSLAEGAGSIASGDCSHAEGNGTYASGNSSHAEGVQTIASGSTSHAEGAVTTASGPYSHAEGYFSIASGTKSHAEGYATTALGNQTHAEGAGTFASGSTSHAEGQSTQAFGDNSHSEGNNTSASGTNSHAEGYLTKSLGVHSHAEGISTTALGASSHSEGNSTTAIGDYSHSQGDTTIASGQTSHAEGFTTQALGSTSHAEGYGTIASGNTSHAQGSYTTAGGLNSHSEGSGTTATGSVSHAEGYATKATNTGAHAEGMLTIASGNPSHAEGYATTASGNQSHSEGYSTIASGTTSHAEGQNTIAGGINSHAGGNYAVASKLSEFARSSYGQYGQYGTVDFVGRTTNNTGTEIFLGNTSPNRLTIEYATAYRYKLYAVCMDISGSTKEWSGDGLIKNVSGTTTLVGSAIASTYGDAALTTVPVPTITGDNTNDSLKVLVTGITSYTLNWFIKIEYVRVTTT